MSQLLQRKLKDITQQKTRISTGLEAGSLNVFE